MQTLVRGPKFAFFAVNGLFFLEVVFIKKRWVE